MKNIKVVVVDDSPFSVELIGNILTDNGFQVVGSARCLKEAEQVVAELKPDLVTMDMAMPGADGIECTEAIRKNDPHIKVVMLSLRSYPILLPAMHAPCSIKETACLDFVWHRPRQFTENR